MEAPTTGFERRLVTRYRRRDIGEEELAFVRAQIAQQGGGRGGRKALAERICEAWGWRQRNGAPALRACLDLLLRLEEWGHVELPPSLHARRGGRKVHPLLAADLVVLRGLDVGAEDADLDTLVVRPVAPEEQEGWRMYMDRYHYLGYRPIVGEHIEYAAMLGDDLVALLGWGSAALRAPLRERWVGWDEATQRERLHLVADNVRFLVLPWVKVPHLASKILATNLRRLSDDWQRRWGHPVHLAETFVDPRRFRGTCYRASNWIHLGQTAGRSKRGNAYLHGGSAKALFVYPLHRKARERLGGGTLGQREPPPAPVDATCASSTPPAAPACAPDPAPGPAPGPVAPPSAARTGRGNSRRCDLALTPQEREELERRARGQAVEHRAVVRARAILRVAADEPFSSVAKAVGLGRGAVRMWARRFARKRLAGLEDEPRPGRPARFPP